MVKTIKKRISRKRGVANPTATLAEKKGLKYTVVTSPTGSQRGVVTLKSGRRVDAWKWYRKVKSRKPKTRHIPRKRHKPRKRQKRGAVF